MKSRVSLTVDCFDARFPRPVFARFVVESDFDFTIETIVEQFPILVADLDLLAADRNQVIADVDLYPIFVGGSAFIDVGHFITTGGAVRLQIKSRVSGRNSACRTS